MYVSKLPLPVATLKLNKSHTKLILKFFFLLKISCFSSNQKLGCSSQLISHMFLISLYFSALLLLLAAPGWYLSCPRSIALKLTSPKFPELLSYPNDIVPTLKLTAPTMWSIDPPLHPTVSPLNPYSLPVYSNALPWIALPLLYPHCLPCTCCPSPAPHYSFPFTPL